MKFKSASMKIAPTKTDKTKLYILKYLLKFKAGKERNSFVNNCNILSLKFLYEIDSELCSLKNIQIAFYICKKMNIAPLFPDVLYAQISSVHYSYNRKKNL